MSPVQQEQKARIIAQLEQIAESAAALREPLRTCAEALKTLDDYVLGANLLEGDSTLARLAQGIADAARKARANLAVGTAHQTRNDNLK